LPQAFERIGADRGLETMDLLIANQLSSMISHQLGQSAMSFL
jgi:hypothetical protein